VLAITNNKTTTRSQTFTYTTDGLNRLAKAVSGTTWGAQFSYDAWGNLYSATGVTGTTYVAMTVNQTGINNKNQFTQGGYGYDAAGNVLNDGLASGCGTSGYQWNAEGQMSCANGTTYAYDGDGLRVKKSSGTLYWGGVVAESDASGNLTSEYIFFGGKRVARRDVSTGTVYYYLSDHLGSSNVVASATGAIVNESDFYPFGGERQITNTLANQHFKFTGKERDAETGLDDFGARYYNSGMGRFMSPDWSAKAEPVPYAKTSNPQSLNLYAYALNNPLSHVDLHGHDAMTAGKLLGYGSLFSGDVINGNSPQFWILTLNLIQERSRQQQGKLKSDRQLAQAVNDKENDAFNECRNKKTPGAVAAASTEMINEQAQKIGDSISEGGASGEIKIPSDNTAQQLQSMNPSLGGETVDAMKECAVEHPRAVLSKKYQGVDEPFGAGGIRGFFEDVSNAPSNMVNNMINSILK
jgi:RHS repeat-associated protein